MWEGGSFFYPLWAPALSRGAGRRAITPTGPASAPSPTVFFWTTCEAADSDEGEVGPSPAVACII